MGDSVAIEQHIPCPCGKSSDAYTMYDDGHGHCYSCGATHQPKEKMVNDQGIYTYQYVPWRSVTRETMEFYDVKTKVDAEGNPIALGYPHNNGTAVQVRDRNSKQFRWTGDAKIPGVFGKEKFGPASARSITITEGALDALSVYQIMGSKYPVVSVRSASTARADCTADREFLNSFERIYLCFDNDLPGQEALRTVAPLFDFNKIYHVKLGKKDPNEYLDQGDVEEFRRIWFNSGRFLPEGIYSSYASFDDILDNSATRVSVPIPQGRLNDMVGGFEFGRSYLVTALEGVGKTELIRNWEYHILKNTDYNIGVIHIEEEKDEQLKRLAGQELKLPVHIHDTPVSKDEIKAALRTITRRDERLHLYSHFGSDDPNVIIDTIRFLVAACGCKYIFLDHITMVVSGLMGDDERKQLDYLSTRLEMMVKELDFCLIFVSHVNDQGLTRGSRNISKVADKWIHITRNLGADTEFQRNVAYLTVLKNRGRSQSGPAGLLTFNPDSYTLEEVSGELPV